MKKPKSNVGTEAVVVGTGDWLGSVVFDFVATPEARNKIKTREMAQHLIDRMEADLPHDALPPHYNWLVAHRDSLPVDCGSGTVFGVCRKCGKGHGYPVSLRPNVAVRDAAPRPDTPGDIRPRSLCAWLDSDLLTFKKPKTYDI